MKSVISDRPLFYHHMEWILMHPRFGFMMMGLIALSFTHNQILAAVLFVFFIAELSMRIAIILNKRRTNPYRSSMNQKIDVLFLALDIIGILSLLITILDIPLDAENAAAARLIRAFYLLRTLRMFRYLDLQSAMYSPTYGMLISLIILLSFFVHDTLMWVIIIFFSVELAIRLIIMRNMNYESRYDKISEWGYWWVDTIATIVMVPLFAFIPYGGALRMLRLVRLLRPWMVIIRNLKEVMREGQFMQEINLIVLLLAVLSIGGGVIGHYTLTEFDYSQDGRYNELDQGMFAPIWFAFRMFTDPVNAVTYPEETSIAVFSVGAVIVGVFIFAFFIGIGAHIVSGLMAKLRNERLNITNHMVMLGWSSVAPFIVTQLKIISERSFSKLKLVILNNTEQMPETLIEHNWVSYRWGSMEEVKSLQRINLGHARQAIINVPDGHSAADNLANATFSLIAIRRVNPDIYLNVATPGMANPHLDSHHHMLQIGWDTTEFYNKPTVVLSQADVRANLFRNILVYRDFDQVMERLMIPERTEDSSLQVSEWGGMLQREGDQITLSLPDGSQSMPLNTLAARLLVRGVTLVALADKHGRSHPLYKVAELELPMQVPSILGIAIGANALHSESLYTIKQLHNIPQPEAITLPLGVEHTRNKKELRLLITGWVGSLPLLLQRLLDDFETIHVTLIDDMTKKECANQLSYLRRRIDGTPGANERIEVEMVRWDFTDMNFLRPYVKGADRILLSRAPHLKAHAYASISTVLSHLVTIVKEQGGMPDIFPVMENRDQALLLQQELERFNLPHEIHITVPNAFYGTYVAHTSYHMYSSENQAAYELQRTLRHTIDDMMGDVGDTDDMDLQTLTVTAPLPEDAEALHTRLLADGYVWIGYRLKHSFTWSDPLQNTIRKLFPREEDYSCLRQHQIILNPFGNPVFRYSWTQFRENIAELIVIGASRGD
ncbi:MAG: hypothetical protein CO187_07640 [Zetaproteobacteria bacterium CG_4_9_14_3_um_filter_53_7]|nr:MAG: hypothetical protein CO187_07640 [Zetaproteobacteria bacterium CG_4_9_14_3_um_filter_53_7]